MDAARRILKVLAICCLCNMASHAQPADPADGLDASKGLTVTIELMKLEVTDSSLGLTYAIRNGSDHDVWVCTDVSSVPFEVYLTNDGQTLLIRKRLDVPTTVVWHRPPPAGTYRRLSPGTARAESLLLDLPVAQKTVYASPTAAEPFQTVRHLTLEIGYYDEDLPALVRSIFDMAEKFNLESGTPDPNMERTYFRGLAVRRALASYGTINDDPDGTGYVRIDYSYQALTGEKVLRMEISGVGILCGRKQ
jgi:hypothetical protein